MVLKGHLIVSRNGRQYRAAPYDRENWKKEIGNESVPEPPAREDGDLGVAYAMEV